MALFKRKNSNGQVPAELEQYYDRPTWQVWVRRIVAVAVVALILFAVYMLARAVYRGVTDDGDDKTTGNSLQSQSENEKKNEDKKNEQKQKNTKSQENNSSTNNAPQSQNAQPGQGSAIPRTGDDPTDQPPAGAGPSALPRTGDDPSDPLPPGYTQ